MSATYLEPRENEFFIDKMSTTYLETTEDGILIY